MGKFHIDKSGQPAKCTATVRHCPLGGEEEHYETMKEAQEAADNKHAEEYGVLSPTGPVVIKASSIGFVQIGNEEISTAHAVALVANAPGSVETFADRAADARDEYDSIENFANAKRVGPEYHALETMVGENDQADFLQRHPEIELLMPTSDPNDTTGQAAESYVNYDPKDIVLSKLPADTEQWCAVSSTVLYIDTLNTKSFERIFGGPESADAYGAALSTLEREFSKTK